MLIIFKYYWEFTIILKGFGLMVILFNIRLKYAAKVIEVLNFLNGLYPVEFNNY